MIEITVEWLAWMVAEALNARGVSDTPEQVERDIRAWLASHDAEVLRGAADEMDSFAKRRFDRARGVFTSHDYQRGCAFEQSAMLLRRDAAEAEAGESPW